MIQTVTTYKPSLAAIIAGLILFSICARAQNPCDLTRDGTVNAADVTLALNMTLGQSSCTANVQDAGVCNAVVIQRVINAALGSGCVTGTSGNAHSIGLTWAPSISPNIAGYNLYRAITPNGAYIKVNSALVSGTSYSDRDVEAGQTYYYVATAVDADNNESDYSNMAQATVPVP
jgi:hypothetical protein